jgi:hypothetical protein
MVSGACVFNQIFFPLVIRIAFFKEEWFQCLLKSR